jgi:hypothetical protein
MNMDNKGMSKEELKKQKDEEKLKKEEEILKRIKEVDLATKNIRVKKDNLSENFLKLLKDVLPLNRNKYKNEKIPEELFDVTTRLIELAVSEKDLINFQDKLSSDEKADLIRYFHLYYDKFSKKMNCASLKPAKIYAIHQNIIEKEGVGIVGRSMFSIQK